MEHICKIGESPLYEIDTIHETMPPVWTVAYCLEGSACLSVFSDILPFTKGSGVIITNDMFPNVSDRTPDFKAFYLIIDRNFAENATYNMPNAFFDAIYIQRVLKIDSIALPWIRLIKSVIGTDAGYRSEIISSLLHGFILDFFSQWEITYGKSTLNKERTHADKICSIFYNLVADNFREHHDTAYYADRLNITPNYLAMLIRQICFESPKEAINRQLVLEIKHLLRTSSLSIEQISHQLHFNTPSYLCRFSRKHTGMSLSEFRKQQL